MRVSLVVAMTPERVIGAEGRLPWRLPADLRNFKRLTMGHPVIMGRKTFTSIGKPLPGRENIVLTRQPGFTAPGCRVVHSVAAALAVAQETGSTESFVIGGGAVYALFLPLATCIYATIVHAAIAGDTFFPALAPETWVECEHDDHEADAENPHAWSFSVLERRGSQGASGVPGRSET